MYQCTLPPIKQFLWGGFLQENKSGYRHSYASSLHLPVHWGDNLQKCIGEHAIRITSWTQLVYTKIPCHVYAFSSPIYQFLWGDNLQKCIEHVTTVISWTKLVYIHKIAFSRLFHCFKPTLHRQPDNHTRKNKIV